MNSQHVILLILLDLSAAFDTVDHVNSLNLELLARPLIGFRLICQIEANAYPFKVPYQKSLILTVVFLRDPA